MGTNYYMSVNACPHCHRGDDKLHIGKSSAGWVFALNTHPEAQIQTLDDWRALWALNPIHNEYGDEISPEEMERIVTGRGEWRPGVPLNRCAPDGRHCIANGEGTYDLHRGEFS